MSIVLGEYGFPIGRNDFLLDLCAFVILKNLFVPKLCDVSKLFVRAYFFMIWHQVFLHKIHISNSSRC